MKQIKYCVAVILYENAERKRFLVVKRPDNDPDFGREWGLPATTSRPGELPEDVARRICVEKLCCSAKPDRFVGTMFQKRNSYDIYLMDIEMTLTGTTEPDVFKATTNLTKYIDQQWTDDPMKLSSSARKGSCCASIMLADRGILQREKWISSLEGSKLVA